MKSKYSWTFGSLVVRAVMLLVLMLAVMAFLTMAQTAKAENWQNVTNAPCITQTNASLTAGQVLNAPSGSRRRTRLTVSNTNTVGALAINFSNLSGTNGGYANFTTNGVLASGVTNTAPYVANLIVPANTTIAVKFDDNGMNQPVSARQVATSNATINAIFEEGGL